MKTFRTAYVGVSRSALAADWDPAIHIFAKAHAKFAAAYNTVKPQAQRSRNPDLLTPKLFCFINHVPRWIHQNNCSLARDHEQAGESQHSDYKRHEMAFHIPHTAERPSSALLPPVPDPSLRWLDHWVAPVPDVPAFPSPPAHLDPFTPATQAFQNHLATFVSRALEDCAL